MHPDSIARQPASARTWTGAPPGLPDVSRPIFPAYAGQTYYDIPPIKPSHYKWRTAVAFFLTGLAGGGQIIATQADWFGDSQDRWIVRAGRYLALSGGVLSTITLISALHTKQRWYNMLRMFKITSPMSIGIWSITPFTIFSALTAAGQVLEDIGKTQAGRRIGRILGPPSALLGGIVISYMGTELEGTNMPLWAGGYPAMAPLYASAGISNAAAALLLLNGMNGGSGGAARGLKKLAFVSGGAESALSAALDAAWHKMPETGSFQATSYFAGYRLAEAAGVGSLALRMLDGFDRIRNTGAGITASLLKLAGAALMQWVLVYAGRESGKHPRDYFEYTRAEKYTEGSRHLPPAADIASVDSPIRGRSNHGERRRPMSAGLRWSLIGLGVVALLTFIPKKGASHEPRPI